MTNNFVYIVIACLLITISTHSTAEQINQESNAKNSPNIANVDGDVIITIHEQRKYRIPSFTGRVAPNSTDRIRYFRSAEDFNKFMINNIRKVVYIDILFSHEQMEIMIKFSKIQRKITNKKREESGLKPIKYLKKLTILSPYDDVVHFLVHDNYHTRFERYNGIQYFIDISDTDDFYFKPRENYWVLQGYFKILGSSKLRETKDVEYLSLKPVNIESVELLKLFKPSENEQTSDKKSSNEPIIKKGTDKYKITSEVSRLLRKTLPNKPLFRSDYTDYYFPKNNTILFNSDLLYYKHEYFLEYIGCCADPGESLILLSNKKTDLTAIKKFSKQNSCRINQLKGEDDIDYFTGISAIESFIKSNKIRSKKLTKITDKSIRNNLITITCHESDDTAISIERTSSDNKLFFIHYNKDGAILSKYADDGKIYLGKDCDTYSKEYGKGTWGWNKKGFTVSFKNHNIIFPQQDVDILYKSKCKRDRLDKFTPSNN